MTVEEQFVEWLAQSEPDLARFIAIVKKFVELQYPDMPTGGGDGPIVVEPGKVHPMNTVALSSDEIDSLTKSMASAAVKQKAIEFVKGFVAGLEVVL